MQHQEIRKEMAEKAETMIVTAAWQTPQRDGGYSAVSIKIKLNGHEYTGVGNAKYNPNDSKCPDTPFSYERGRQIAIGRALHDVASQIHEERAAEALVAAAALTEPIERAMKAIGGIFGLFGSTLVSL